METAPLDASIVKSAVSVPSLLQVTSPIGVPESVGAGEAKAVFSATVPLDRPDISSVADSRTSVTVTVIEALALFSSSSEARTVTS